MTYNCEVHIVIIGKCERIRQFARYILNLNIQGNEVLLPQFKIIKFSSDSSMFAFYTKSINWCDKCDIFWKLIRTEAAKTEFSYLFRRVIENTNNVEECYRLSVEDSDAMKSFNILENIKLHIKH